MTVNERSNGKDPNCPLLPVPFLTWSSRVWFHTLCGGRSPVTYTQSNCTPKEKVRSAGHGATTLTETTCIRPNVHKSAHLVTHVTDILQQVLQGLQGTVTVVVTPRAGGTLASSCSKREFGKQERKRDCGMPASLVS